MLRRRRAGHPDGPIAQLDRVTDFYSVGCRFESCWDRQKINQKGPLNKGFLDIEGFVSMLIFPHRRCQKAAKNPKRVPQSVPHYKYPCSME